MQHPVLSVYLADHDELDARRELAPASDQEAQRSGRNLERLRIERPLWSIALDGSHRFTASALVALVGTDPILALVIGRGLPRPGVVSAARLEGEGGARGGPTPQIARFEIPGHVAVGGRRRLGSLGLWCSEGSARFDRRDQVRTRHEEREDQQTRAAARNLLTRPIPSPVILKHRRHWTQRAPRHRGAHRSAGGVGPPHPGRALGRRTRRRSTHIREVAGRPGITPGSNEVAQPASTDATVMVASVTSPVTVALSPASASSSSLIWSLDVSRV